MDHSWPSTMHMHGTSAPAISGTTTAWSESTRPTWGREAGWREPRAPSNCPLMSHRIIDAWATHHLLHEVHDPGVFSHRTFAKWIVYHSFVIWHHWESPIWDFFLHTGFHDRDEVLKPTVTQCYVCHTKSHITCGSLLQQSKILFLSPVVSPILSCIFISIISVQLAPL